MNIKVSILVLMDSRVKTHQLYRHDRGHHQVSILVLMDSRVKTVLAVSGNANNGLFQSLF